MPTRFGASDTRRCPECKNLMRLTNAHRTRNVGTTLNCRLLPAGFVIMRSKEAPISWARSHRDPAGRLQPRSLRPRERYLVTAKGRGCFKPEAGTARCTRYPLAQFSD